MATITITEKEYRELSEKARRYEFLKSSMEEDLFSSPPRNASRVMAAFKKSGKYSKKFLAGLEKGLRRSDYFKN